MSSPYIAVAVKAARRAASEISRAAADLDLLEVENKSVNDYVTNADRAAEAVRLRTGLSSVCTRLVVLLPAIVDATAISTASTTAAIRMMRTRFDKNVRFMAHLVSAPPRMATPNCCKMRESRHSGSPITLK